MSKNISIDEVKKLARLAKISLTEAELKKMTGEVDSLLAYVKQLEEVDTADLEPTSQVTGLQNVNRSDEIVDFKISREKYLENAPDSQDGQFKTKRVL